MKKFVTSLLAVVMLLSLCAGCGGQKENSDTPAAQAPSPRLPLPKLLSCGLPTATMPSTSPVRPARCSLIW